MKPNLAITMGDPAGVGPEIIARVWTQPTLHDLCRPCVVGHPEWMRRTIKQLGISIDVVEVRDIGQATDSPDCMPCVCCVDDAVLDVPIGHVDRRAGQAAFDSVTWACHAALDGRVDGIVTAPLNKAALSAAGQPFPGHTELLAKLCGIRDVAMMLYLGRGPGVQGRGGLGVAHVTLHTALRDVFAQLTQDRILQTARLVDTVMRTMLKQEQDAQSPRIAVCALNPHGGEQGLFGDEEQQIIEPAVCQGVAEGLLLAGPLPVDTLFAQAADGLFDGVVAMYHDQGHIALKLIDWHRAVNVTLGLPIIRTSVAHGTAFDLAGQGRAQSDGMLEAIRVATRLIPYRNQLQGIRQNAP